MISPRKKNKKTGKKGLKKNGGSIQEVKYLKNRS